MIRVRLIKVSVLANFGWGQLKRHDLPCDRVPSALRAHLWRDSRVAMACSAWSIAGMNFLDRWHDYWSPHEAIDTSPKISDEVKYTTCYMCACRCGIKVHLKDGGIRYIEGNREHPVNRGVICGKGASGHHAAVFAGKAQKAADAGRRARLRRVPRDRVGRGDRDGDRLAVADSRRRPEESSPSSPAAIRASR